MGELQHLLERGCIYVATGEGAVQTVLGSCVSVCLWDPEAHCGGMNHFIYPQTMRKEQATPKYGNVATMALIKLMCEEGCSPAQPDRPHNRRRPSRRRDGQHGNEKRRGS